jgi:hypothetical protein
MQIAIPTKLDDMNLSPEAFRLYHHLRCQAARISGNNCHPDELIIPNGLTRILEMLGLPADSTADLELERRRILSFRYDWEENATRVIFHREEVWQ